MSNEELVAAIQVGATERMSELWEQVAGLVKWRANHVMTALEGCSGRGIEFEDLYQSGYIALVAAVESYDPAAGAFSTWFTYHLKTVFAEATGYRTQKGKHEPMDNAISLDRPLSDDADSDVFGDLIPDNQAAATMQAVEERAFQKQLHDALEGVLQELPDDYSEVLRLRYYTGRTLAEVGTTMGVGSERIRQIENKAIRVIRQPRNVCKLRSFYDFNSYVGTGLTAFTNTGMSIQEKYLIQEEAAQEREKERQAKRQKRHHEKAP